MKKNVMIKIMYQQLYDGEDGSINELTTQGKYSFTDEEIRLSYMESALTGLEGTETTFSVTPEEAVLTRKGAVTAQMVFHKGQKHTFAYDTPYGAITMRLDTIKMNNELDKNGGKLDIEYDLDLENAPLSRNKVYIEVRERKIH